MKEDYDNWDYIPMPIVLIDTIMNELHTKNMEWRNLSYKSSWFKYELREKEIENERYQY